MVINEAIKSLMEKEGVTQARMATAIGYSNQRTISSKLMSNNMTFDRAIEMLEVMGYEVVIQKRKPGARARDQIVLEMSTAAKKPEEK